MVVDSIDDLSSLSTQQVDRVELVSLGGPTVDAAASDLAASRGWSFRAAGSSRAAMESATGEFIVSWTGIHGPRKNSLQKLMDAARAEPAKLGASAAHFDGLALWRSSPDSAQRGLAQADTKVLAERDLILIHELPTS